MKKSKNSLAIKKYLLLLIVAPLCSMAQYVQVVNLQTNDIIFNRLDNKIYASTPSYAGTKGNCICIINPVTATIDTCIFIGSEPNKLAISDNGEKIYVGLDGAGAIRVFDVTMQAAGQQFSLANSAPGSPPLFVEDLAFLTGSTNSIVVSRRKNNYHEDVAVYDAGIKRPNALKMSGGNNSIEVVSPTLVVGFNNASTGWDLRTIQVNNNGTQLINSYQGLIAGFGVELYYSKNRIYSTNGTVLSIGSGIPTLLATFYDVSGPMVADTTQKLLCYAAQDYWTNEVFIKRFSRSSFVLVDTIQIRDTTIQGDVINLINWGDLGKMAFNTDAGEVVIIGQTALDISESSLAKYINVYPNPTDGILNVSIKTTPNSPVSLSVYDMRYNLLVELKVESTNTQIDLSLLESGMYIVELKFESETKQYKIVKK